MEKQETLAIILPFWALQEYDMALIFIISSYMLDFIVTM